MSLGRDTRQNFPLQLDLTNRRGGEAARPEREASETRQAVNASKRRLDPAHRKPLPPSRRPSADGEPIVIRRAGDHVARRSLDFYEAVGRGLAGEGRTPRPRMPRSSPPSSEPATSKKAPSVRSSTSYYTSTVRRGPIAKTDHGRRRQRWYT